jgi:hypothetical protein
MIAATALLAARATGAGGLGNLFGGSATASPASPATPAPNEPQGGLLGGLRRRCRVGRLAGEIGSRLASAESPGRRTSGPVIIIPDLFHRRRQSEAADNPPGEFSPGRDTEPDIICKGCGDVEASLGAAHTIVELALWNVIRECRWVMLWRASAPRVSPACRSRRSG